MDGTAVNIQCYTIDGDLYFNVEDLAKLFGMSAEKRQDSKGYILATASIQKE